VSKERASQRSNPPAFAAHGYDCGVGTFVGGGGSLAGGGSSFSQPMTTNMLKSSSNVDNTFM
jgi:hypothetical protein